MQTRIKELNKKFYPQRYIPGWLGGWASEWPSVFINGEWCGRSVIYDFDSLEEAKQFLANRQVTLYNADGTTFTPESQSKSSGARWWI